MRLKRETKTRRRTDLAKVDAVEVLAVLLDKVDEGVAATGGRVSLRVGRSGDGGRGVGGKGRSSGK